MSSEPQQYVTLWNAWLHNGVAVFVASGEFLVSEDGARYLLSSKEHQKAFVAHGRPISVLGGNGVLQKKLDPFSFVGRTAEEALEHLRSGLLARAEWLEKEAYDLRVFANARATCFPEDRTNAQ
ncbi:MAG: hypothetical protein GY871_04350 [Actinomycetales bacterium]|nr:hypothetical protein [Actinomycetales bacterium]